MRMLLRTTDLKSRFQDRLWLEQTGTILLVAAGLVVAVAIAASGALARGTNGIAGMAIGLMFRERGVAWAKVLAALWLPEHLGTAAGKAIYRAVRDLPTSVRT